MAKKSLQDINPLEYDLSTNVSVSPKQQTDRLIQLGKGIYKDKISGKLLYNYDEMPTAEVVGHKKEKSINDNWQKAYAKGIPSGTMPRYDGAYFDAVLPTVEIVGKRKRKNR